MFIIVFLSVLIIVFNHGFIFQMTTVMVKSTKICLHCLKVSDMHQVLHLAKRIIKIDIHVRAEYIILKTNKVVNKFLDP